MSDRIRAALQRLSELEGHTLVDCTADWAEAMIEARAALAAEAEHEVAGPTDNDLLACMIEAARSVPDGQAIGIADWDQEAIAADRARYSHHPAPPAEGEVAELVARLRRASDGASAMGWEQDSWIIARAADLLEQRHPAPVPVSERPWEREGWCDEQGRCWFGWHRPMHILNPAMWMLCSPDVRDILFHQACLPAHALPLPAGEVE